MKLVLASCIFTAVGCVAAAPYSAEVEVDGAGSDHSAERLAFEKLAEIKELTRAMHQAVHGNGQEVEEMEDGRWLQQGNSSSGASASAAPMCNFTSLFASECTLKEYCAAEANLTGAVVGCTGDIGSTWTIQLNVSATSCVYSDGQGPYDLNRYNSTTDYCYHFSYAQSFKGDRLSNATYVGYYTHPFQSVVSVAGESYAVCGPNRTADFTYGSTDFCARDCSGTVSINNVQCLGQCQTCPIVIVNATTNETSGGGSSYNCSNVDPNLVQPCDSNLGTNDFVPCIVVPTFLDEAQPTTPPAASGAAGLVFGSATHNTWVLLWSRMMVLLVGVGVASSSTFLY
jgi:hypothetical protein